MKKKDFRELKTKEVKELTKMLDEKRLESLKIKAKIASGQEKNIKAYRNLRSEIAGILTLVGEKKIMEKLQPKEDKKV